MDRARPTCPWRGRRAGAAGRDHRREWDGRRRPGRGGRAARVPEPARKSRMSDRRDPAVMTASRTPIGRLLDLALPAVCPGCGAEGPAICARCLPRVRPAAAGARDAVRARRGSAGAAAPARVVRALCRRRAPGPPRAEYAGERRLAEPLGEAVGARWRVAGVGGTVIVPVPVHEGRRRQRGYDQAALIAAVAARELRLPAVEAVGGPTRPRRSTGSTGGIAPTTSGTRSPSRRRHGGSSPAAGSSWSMTS